MTRLDLDKRAAGIIKRLSQALKDAEVTSAEIEEGAAR